jgi:hypothetical protein
MPRCTGVSCGRVAPANSSSSSHTITEKEIKQLLNDSRGINLEERDVDDNTMSTEIGMLALKYTRKPKDTVDLYARYSLIELASKPSITVSVGKELTVKIPQLIINMFDYKTIFSACISIILDIISIDDESKLFQLWDDGLPVRIFYGDNNISESFYKELKMYLKRHNKKIAIYEQAVVDHSSRSINAHWNSINKHKVRRVIGYISRDEMERMRQLYKKYRIHDAPSYYATNFTTVELFKIILEKPLFKKYSGLLHNLVRFEVFPFKSQRLNAIIKKYKSYSFYIIPFSWSLHACIMVILNGHLMLIDPNCAVTYGLEKSYKIIEQVAEKNGLIFSMPLNKSCFLQACESTQVDLVIDRPGYCLPWSQFITEILCDNRNALLDGTITIKGLLTVTLDGFRPVLARKIIVDYLYTRHTRLKHFKHL